MTPAPITRPLAALAALGLLASATLQTTPAHAMPDTPTNRAAEAERYERAVPVERLLEASIARVAALMPPEHRAAFSIRAHAEIDPEPLRAGVLKALTETFTADELAAMTSFFGSDVGRSVSAKMTGYTHRVMPLILGTVQQSATRYANEQAPPQ